MNAFRSDARRAVDVGWRSYDGDFVSEPGEHLPPPKPGRRDHVCDGVSFSPFEIYVRQSAG